MPKEVEPKTVIVYADASGKEPFTTWLNGLADLKGKRKIAIRITRLQAGLYGDCKSVGEGVSELRIFFGPGYRVYFGEKDGSIVILLCGGDKSTQDKDIRAAQTYWKDYNNDDS